MYAFVFSSLAAVIFALGYWRDRSPVWVCCWLGGSFFGFVLIRYFFYYRKSGRLGAAFHQLLDRYTAAYGNTSSGQKFLNDAPAWHEGMFAQGAELSLLTGDWSEALIGAAVQAIGSFFATATKPAEQSALEQQLVTVLQDAAECKKQFSISVVITAIAYATAAVAASTMCSPQSLQAEVDSSVVAVQPQIITVAEAQRVAVQRFPQLSIAGSKLNSEFVSRYKLYQETRPDFFRDTSWPIRLAEEISGTSSSK